MSDQTPKTFAVAPTGKLPNIPFHEMHVLIVDDDETFLQTCDSLLKTIGVGRTTRAVNGSDAYFKLTNLLRDIPRVADCILCDISMQNGNGLQLLKAVRSGLTKYLRPDACFILLTATADTRAIAVAAELDASACLVKPLTPLKLKETILKARERKIDVDREKYARVVLPSL